MSQPSNVRVEASTGLSRGAREEQEDAVLCDVPQGGAAGLLILADGLGGHAGGALASRIAVTTVLNELSGHRDPEGVLQGDIPALLETTADAANHAILAHAEASSATTGMGTTLLVAVVQEGHLNWLSVGDSPLFLLRDGALERLNEIHSLAPQLDLLVRVGEMSAEEAQDHPGRNCLTSALGCDTIEKVDCPETPYTLRPGDVLIAASDGILTLSAEEITQIIATADRDPSCDLAAHLLTAIAAARAEEQDNVSLAVLRVQPAQATAQRQEADAPPPRLGLLRRLFGRKTGAPRPAPGLPGAMARVEPSLEAGQAP